MYPSIHELLPISPSLHVAFKSHSDDLYLHSQFACSLQFSSLRCLPFSSILMIFTYFTQFACSLQFPLLWCLPFSPIAMIFTYFSQFACSLQFPLQWSLSISPSLHEAFNSHCYDLFLFLPVCMKPSTPITMMFIYFSQFVYCLQFPLQWSLSISPSLHVAFNSLCYDLYLFLPVYM